MVGWFGHFDAWVKAGENSSTMALFARDAGGADKLSVFVRILVLKTIDQATYEELCKGASILEADAFGVKVLRLADGSILKLFRLKRAFSSATLFPYASRFIANAYALKRLGVRVPEVLESFRIRGLRRDAVRYSPLPGITLRELERNGLGPNEKAMLIRAFTHFVIGLHRKGVYFRSLHIGNVVLTPEHEFGLIDFTDLRIYPWSLARFSRIRNVRRMAGIPEERDWLDMEAIANGRVSTQGGWE